MKRAAEAGRGGKVIEVKEKRRQKDQLNIKRGCLVDSVGKKENKAIKETNSSRGRAANPEHSRDRARGKHKRQSRHLLSKEHQQIQQVGGMSMERSKEG